MKVFDQEFAREMLSRLESMPEDARPQWGAMTRGQLIGHLASMLRYTAGEGPEIPFKGNFKSRTVFKFLILSGIKPIPHNVRLPRPAEIPKEAWFKEESITQLREAVDAYFAMAAENALPTRIHPFFGPLTGRQWQRMHRIHAIHHLTQFGIAGGL